MRPAIKSELRKLLTVRSTYFILLGVVLLTAFVNFWANGYKFEHPAANHLQEFTLGAINGAGFFVGIAPLLLVSHEYRHNLIYYTLTASNSRSRVFLAKLIVIILYTTVFLLILMAVSLVALVIGAHMGGHALPAQHIEWWPLIWRGWLFLVFISSMAAVFGFAVRNQIGAFVTYLLYPGPVEQLIGLLLKSKAMYLPFYAISGVMGQAGQTAMLSPHRAAVVAGMWVAGSLLVSWLLFVKRDAN